MLFYCPVKLLVLELEFKVIPPEFPEFKDLFVELVSRSIYSLTIIIDGYGVTILF